MENFYEVHSTASEVTAYARYDQAARRHNTVALGNGENPDDGPHLCHCGQPLNDADCECGTCAAEWQEFITAWHALAHPGAMM